VAALLSFRGKAPYTLTETLKQAPTFFIRRVSARAFHLDPTALLSGAIRCMASLGHNAFEFHAIGRLQQLDAIIKAFRIAQPIGICSEDQLLGPLAFSQDTELLAVLS
jgi:hypothetical protein